MTTVKVHFAGGELREMPDDVYQESCAELPHITENIVSNYYREHRRATVVELDESVWLRYQSMQAYINGIRDGVTIKVREQQAEVKPY